MELRKFNLYRNQTINDLSISCLNTWSLLKHIEDLIANIGFGVISESRIVKDKLHVNDMKLKNFCYEYCSTEFAT